MLNSGKKLTSQNFAWSPTNVNALNYKEHFKEYLNQKLFSKTIFPYLLYMKIKLCS